MNFLLKAENQLKVDKKSFSDAFFPKKLDQGWADSKRPKSDFVMPLFSDEIHNMNQGCQIFLVATYQNGKNIYQMTTKFTKWP
jgi:hypothetical protein